MYLDKSAASVIEQLMPRTDPKVLDGVFVSRICSTDEVVTLYTGSLSQCLLLLSYIQVLNDLIPPRTACASHRKKTVGLGPLLRRLAESRTRHKYELSMPDR